MEVIRLKVNSYIHVLDNNTHVTKCVVGPCVFTTQGHETVLFQPKKAVSVPPRSYCRIQNPCIRDETGQPVLDEHGQVKLRHGDEEIRFEQDPFPLMPGEDLVDESSAPIKKLTVVPHNSALRLRCLRDFVDAEGTQRQAGDEWMFPGPATYLPRIEEEVVRTIKATVIKPNTAIRLRATLAFTAADGTKREVGDEWLVSQEGAYLPRPEENVVEQVDAVVLTDKKAVHLQATRDFTDRFGKNRRAGEQWLITNKQATTHIPHVYEKIAKQVNVTTLTGQQFCVVIDPYDPKTGTNSFGRLEVRRGEASFFLHPAEQLRSGVEQIIVLGTDDAVLLQAREAVTDSKGESRKAGETWMIRGPAEYIPPVQVNVVERRKTVALDENEGIYVRDCSTGSVRAVVGQAYLLNEKEELWSKPLQPVVETLLSRPNGTLNTLHTGIGSTKSSRNKTEVVRFNVPHNAAIQLHDYKKNTSRIVLGPELVLLQPDEEFTVLSLSGDKPKVPHVIKSLQLFLGPDFSSDHIVVETSDHARLQLKLSYNWHFEIETDATQEKLSKMFTVPDFVGDMCKAIASRVRGAVAAEDFDNFHKHSARIIRTAVFGLDENGKIGKEFKFATNNLVVTNVDIQSVEPTDTKTRDSLQKSVQMAIEITTQSQEATARQQNARKDQEAKGKLERQKLQDKVESEKAKKTFLELQAESEEIHACGESRAEAKARAESSIIEHDSDAKQAKLRAMAYKIAKEGELDQLKAKQAAEISYKKRNNEIEIENARETAEIETEKLAQMMKAIGRETIVAIAEAGPEMQAKLLEGLGLKGYLITDGNSPINLFNTANGMVGPGSQQ